MAAYYKSAKFKKIQAEWYEKLRVSGFEDDESHKYKHNGVTKYRIENGNVIKPKTIDTDITAWANGQGHHDNCCRILREHKFKSDVERYIFELHTEGLSSNEIRRRLLDKFQRTVARKTIENTIKRIFSKFDEGD